MMEERLATMADRELIALLSAAAGVPPELGRELLRRLEARGGAPSPASLRCSAEAWEAFGRRMGAGRRERFWVVALDARNRPVRQHLVALGTLDHCVVHPRDVFRPLVRSGAAACLLVHNHPSGDPTPSLEDEALTRRLVECGRLLGVPVLDHLVVARGGYVSFRDRGLGGLGSDPTAAGRGLAAVEPDLAVRIAGPAQTHREQADGPAGARRRAPPSSSGEARVPAGGTSRAKED